MFPYASEGMPRMGTSYPEGVFSAEEGTLMVPENMLRPTEPKRRDERAMLASTMRDFRRRQMYCHYTIYLRSAAFYM